MENKNSSDIRMSKEPLTLQDLRGMAGKPVYCPDEQVYGIVKCETVGRWAGKPFLIGCWHSDGIAVDFEWDIEKRGLECYQIAQDYHEQEIKNL